MYLKTVATTTMKMRRTKATFNLNNYMNSGHSFVRGAALISYCCTECSPPVLARRQPPAWSSVLATFLAFVKTMGKKSLSSSCGCFLLLVVMDAVAVVVFVVVLRLLGILV